MLTAVRNLAASTEGNCAATDLRLEGIENMVVKLSEGRTVDSATVQKINNINNTLEHHHRQQQGMPTTLACYST